MSDLEDQGGGYGRPPKRHQFQKGQSGNPRGRPRTVQTLPEIVARLRDELVPITIDGKRKNVRIIEAAIRQTIANCFKSSNPRHLEKLLELLERHGVTPADVQGEQARASAEQAVTKIFQYFERTHPDNNRSLEQTELERQEVEIIGQHLSCQAALRALWRQQDANLAVTRKSYLRSQIEAVQRETG